MQIKPTSSPWRIQLVNSVYMPDKKRGVDVNLGSMSVLQPVPPDLWNKLSATDRIKLMSYIARKLEALNLGALQGFAETLPSKLEDVTGAWPAIAENIGTERAAALGIEIEAGFKALKKALKAAPST